MKYRSLLTGGPAARKTTHRHPSGFTLMELLVVVAILAIVAGLVTVAYDGLVGQAAKSAATNAIGSLSNSISVYKVTERRLPSNLDTLVAVTPTTVAWDPLLGDNITTTYSNTGEALIRSLNAQLSAKLTLRPLTAPEKTSLIAAGITKLRYIDSNGNSEAVSSTLVVPSAGGGTNPTVGSIALVDIPSHLFDIPLNSTDYPAANRGRGFAVDLANLPAATLPSVAVLNPGAGAYEYVKLGASPTSVLIVLGVGKNSSIVQASGNVSGTATQARLAAAPFYGDVGRAEYPNYLAVIDVSRSPAQFITVLDPTGGSMAEDYAAGRGQ